jgi:N-glycosidase YbiA
MSRVTLNFYETSMPYGCFSNFSRHAIEVAGRTWATAEHFFQASKFTDHVDVEAIRNAKSPFIAAQLGRERGRSFRTDWENLRDELMLTALRAKFTQHASIGAVLASTSGARLVEHTRNDRYWGDGGDGRGANRLGSLLEQVRSELPPWPAPFTAPPWVERPDIEPSDLFWRMGGGERYLTAASRFRLTLSGEAQAHYEAYFPTPKEWLLSG